MRFVQLVEGFGFVADRLAGVFEGWDRAQQVPGAFIVVEGQHPAAANRVGAIGQTGAIETAAQNA